MPIHLRTFSLLLIAFCICGIGLQAQSDHYLHFDGADDFAQLPDASQYFTGATGISMTGWFCAENPGYGRGYMGFRQPGGGSEMYIIEIGSGMLECRYISTAGFQEYVSPTGTVQGGVWQHVAWTFTGTQTILYINGQPLGSTPSGGTFSGTGTTFAMGMSLTACCNFVFSGRMDEVSVWSKGLTQAEIQDVMANELVGNEAQLELYYKMNQGIPGGNNTGITQLISEVGGGTRDADLLNFSMSGPTSNFNESAIDPSFTAPDFCVDQANQVILTGTPGGVFSFQPVPADGASIDPLTGEITGGVVGTTYTIRYTTIGPCAIYETHDVTVMDSPVIANVAETCSIDQLSYSVSFDITGGDPSTNSVSGAGSISGSTFTSAPIASGTPYDFTLTAGNSCGSDNVSGTITCTCPAQASFSPDFSICPDGIGQIEITLEGSPPWTLDYELDGLPQPPIMPSASPYIMLISEAGTYTFTSASDANCTSTLSMDNVVEVGLLGNPTATISGMEEICAGEEALLPIELSGTGPWDVSYAIDGIAQGVLNFTDPSTVLLATQAGEYTLTFVTDQVCGGDGTGSAEVIVHQLPEASVGGTIVLCEGSVVLWPINVSGTPDIVLDYTIDGVAQDPLTILLEGILEVPVSESGLYALQNISDLYCLGTVLGSTTVELAPLPTATLEDGSFTICEGATHAIGIPLTGTENWTVNYAIDGILQPPLSTSTSPVTLQAGQTGVYELVDVSDNFCSNSTGPESVEILIYPPIDIFVSDDVGSCAGDTVGVSVTTMGGQGGAFQYTWTSLDLVQSNGPSATFDPQSDAVVQVVVSDDCSIDFYFDFPLTVHPLPLLTIDGPQAVCAPGVVELTNGSSAQFVGGQCEWIVEGDTIGQCGSLEYFFEIGTYDVEVNVTSSQGCYNELSIENYIEVFPGLTSDFDFSPTNVSTLSPEVIFSNLSTGEDVGFLWTFGDLPSTSEMHPTILFPIENGGGLYPVCLYVTNDFGCIDSTCTTIKVENELLILAPNSFTPDGDGLNDLFSPTVIGSLDGDYLFRIFDRYGRLLFETTDLDGKWNGDHIQNDEFYSADGVYNWEIIVAVRGTTDKKTFVGSVFLLR